jgi:2-C-methyl-D-erythritol 4-phosphate cytidylyltransferase
VFQDCPAIDEIAIALGKWNLERGRRLVAEYGFSKVVAVCHGGQRRQDSVKCGLKHLGGCQWVVVHDGSRPLVSTDLIERGLNEAQESGAAIAAAPVRDTIKVVSPAHLVEATPQRHTLWAAQTPQVFRFSVLAQAHEQVGEDVTDDATMVERMGHRVKVYMGSHENIKVTTPEDLALAEVILRNRKAS